MVTDGKEPNRVLKYFEDICSIPHGSRDTDRIADYCEEFARSHGLWYRRDDSNNVVIKKPACGSQSDRTVIIQGHLDMVCTAQSDRKIDFKKDGLTLKTDGKFLWADGTTLGGDDGIAVAMALAILESDDIVHPPLECIFTTDEEIGMLGAMALDTSDIDGRILLNIDSEDEGIFTVSCAGGASVVISVPFTEVKSEKRCLKISVSGLTGGHSGVEIDKRRANANIILAKLAAELSEHHNVELCSIEGGEKDNAIPRSASAVVASDDIDTVKAAVYSLAKKYKAPYSETDPQMDIAVSETDVTHIIKSGAVKFLSTVTDGIRTMSSDIDGLVETSSNLGIVRTEKDRVQAVISVRSSVAAKKASLIKEISELAEKCGASVDVEGEYPAWEFNKNSIIQRIADEVYREQTGSDAEFTAIHAGLECGIFCDKLDGLDCISFGPDIHDIHTPQEKLDIESTARVFEFLKECLKRL